MKMVCMFGQDSQTPPPPRKKPSVAQSGDAFPKLPAAPAAPKPPAAPAPACNAAQDMRAVRQALRRARERHEECQQRGEAGRVATDAEGADTKNRYAFDPVCDHRNSGQGGSDDADESYDWRTVPDENVVSAAEDEDDENEERCGKSRRGSDLYGAEDTKGEMEAQALADMLPSGIAKGIFEVFMPGGESLGVAVDSNGKETSYLLTPGSEKTAAFLNQHKTELITRLERRIGRDVQLILL
jgi:hypothetical protein